ncbi:hypothetical protein [Salinispora mooreana]|uniref:hypothetical protein n=1 Tax=Salinispora mooreana TaxID=999545 RepID=UPI0037CB50C8
MRHEDHDHSGGPARPTTYHTRVRRRSAARLAGAAGLALALVGLAVAPAAGAVGRAATGADEQKWPKGTPVACAADALIAAITSANATGGGVFDLAEECTYLLTADIDGAGLPAIVTPITLNGGKNTTIERDAAADQFRIFTVNTGGDLTLNHLKVTGGQTAEDGGGIFVAAGGALALGQSRIVRNISAQEGGGIRNAGTATVAHSHIERNTAGASGGGVASTGALELRSSSVGENVSANGGGVSSAGTVVIGRSAITGNRATSVIGGGLLATGGSALLTDSHVLRNSSNTEGAGVVAISVQLHLRRVVIADNAARSGGGGLIINNTSSATVQQGLIKGNTANTDGGGVFNAGALALFGTEVRGNQATRGGGVHNDAVGAVTFYGATIKKNVAVADGGGVFNEAGGTVELNTATGTVVIENRPNNCVNVAGCPG